MRRVLIIGNSGSGKSTFATKLSEKTGLPLVHLDKLYWRNHWEPANREEFDLQLQNELVKDAWIIDGNYDRTLAHRLSYCDTVFFFDLPVAVCLWGITERLLQNYGRTRRDMGGNCIEKLDRNKWMLYRKVWRFNRENRLKYYELLENTENTIVFKSRKEAKNYLKEVIG